MMNTAIKLYICTAYLVVFAACIGAAFSHLYKANLLQRIAVSMIGIWVAWRVVLIWEHGWDYPHEPVIATALAVYALGSVLKTAIYRYRYVARTKNAAKA